MKTTQSNDFNNQCYYDLFDKDDFEIINNDFKKSYNGQSLRDVIKKDEIKWPELCSMIAGLDPYKSEILSYIRIRSEKDPVKIKKFTPGERKIYLEWKKRHPGKQKTKEQLINESNNFIKALQSMGNFTDYTK